MNLLVVEMCAVTILSLLAHFGSCMSCLLLQALSFGFTILALYHRPLAAQICLLGLASSQTMGLATPCQVCKHDVMSITFRPQAFG
jgi:hypothetical protein